MTGTQVSPNEEMPDEIDFSQGTRGRFLHPDMRLNLPVYLDVEVRDWIAARANARGVEIDRIVNDLLRKNIELVDLAR